ncbi:ribosomal RNA small subunit methyltransferase A [Metamycoplasma phocicerebrale]|uniref:Ribosomal RNA small subunit methyltransferase A n=1 Tax=Metamycoplasma phocicerebrale TaxID=142649 RepID=A0A3T0TTG1_9BACT|nr:16S rRNA (adenine(1518)-N(6)/adenine(1519)-N(6))-dimethyltransferase RsmA [Metamycoplasma phocicerebrale]AZZ65375.1 ribosomal RNA small subunit methyltransferase A [Metamycoplasma phocicerebrale]
MAKIRAKKSFGQNFLINKQIQEKIVSLANVENKNVIEIGPGMGAITDFLISKVSSLKAYELDKELWEYLNKKNYPKNIQIVNEDFLEANINFIEDSKVTIIGNIPYNITSPIIFKLLDNYLKIESATLMIQKEVAERILAIPNSKVYGKLSVTLQIFSNIKKLLDVKASQFNPQPKVDSTVIKIEFIQPNDFLKKNAKEIVKFIALCFQFKRKTLFNNLNTNFSKEKILHSFQELNFDSKIRAENLNKNDFINLFKELN